MQLALLLSENQRFIMHYLIDGHNLIAKMEDIALDDPDDEAKLVLRLRSWTAANKKRRVTVIFDGGLPGGQSTRLSTSRVTVLFASSGQTADDLLIRRIAQFRNPAEYTLISSDRTVIAAAQKRRLPVVLAEAFAAQLPRSRRQDSPPQPEAAEPESVPTGRETPELSEDELNEWLALFGPIPERKAVKPASPPPPPPPLPTPAQPAPPTGQGIGRVDRERPLSAEEIDEWLDLFKQKPK